jgi:hypothetical protein
MLLQMLLVGSSFLRNMRLAYHLHGPTPRVLHPTVWGRGAGRVAQVLECLPSK